MTKQYIIILKYIEEDKINKDPFSREVVLGENY
jgi:hypothetical protein